MSLEHSLFRPEVIDEAGAQKELEKKGHDLNPGDFIFWQSPDDIKYQRVQVTYYRSYSEEPGSNKSFVTFFCDLDDLRDWLEKCNSQQELLHALYEIIVKGLVHYCLFDVDRTCTIFHTFFKDDVAKAPKVSAEKNAPIDHKANLKFPEDTAKVIRAMVDQGVFVGFATGHPSRDTLNATLNLLGVENSIHRATHFVGKHKFIKDIVDVSVVQNGQLRFDLLEKCKGFIGIKEVSIVNDDEKENEILQTLGVRVFAVNYRELDNEHLINVVKGVGLLTEIKPMTLELPIKKSELNAYSSTSYADVRKKLFEGEEDAPSGSSPVKKTKDVFTGGNSKEEEKLDETFHEKRFKSSLQPEELTPQQSDEEVELKLQNATKTFTPALK